jgi:hypothetical protein
VLTHDLAVRFCDFAFLRFCDFAVSKVK